MTVLKIIKIEGIGPNYAKKLESVGINNSDDLLKEGRTPKGRNEIAKKSGISEDLILRWVCLSDLIRIKGVGEEYSDLLKESDVDTIVDLSKGNADNLHKKMLEVNEKKNLVRRAPRLNEVESWISQASSLPRKVEYGGDQKTTSEEAYPDLEDKIAALEAKLSKLTTQLEKPAPKPAEIKPAPKPAEIKPAPKPAEIKPAPKPAETKPPQPKAKPTLPKGSEPKPAETKPAQPKAKPTLPKGSGPKPAEVPKPTETPKQLPATFNEALEDAYYTAPMSDFHKYRASVTGYSPAPNRYFVRKTAPVGKVPTTNWNDQKAVVSGYTQPSNQYFATRARLAHHPADKTFGYFSGTKMTVEGVVVQEKKQEPPKEAPKPAPKPKGTLPKGTLPKGMAQTQTPPPSSNTQSKSREEQLAEYEKEYLQRLEQERIEQEKAYQEELRREAAEAAAKAQTSAGSTRGSLPKGFEPKPEPEAPKTSRGTLPKGF